MKSLKRIVQTCVAIAAVVTSVAGTLSTASAYGGVVTPPSGKASINYGGVVTPPSGK